MVNLSGGLSLGRSIDFILPQKPKDQRHSHVNSGWCSAWDTRESMLLLHLYASRVAKQLQPTLQYLLGVFFFPSNCN